MVRAKDPALRAALLESATAYAMRRGVAGISLRPLAAEIGTSARMLMHHFGSKEVLVSEILARVEIDLGQAMLAEAAPGETLQATLLRFWRRMSDPSLQPLMRSMFEVWGQALVRPEAYRAFLDVVVAPWTAFLTQALVDGGMTPGNARDRALALTAAFQGLQLVRLTTGDDEAAGRALISLINTLDFNHGEPS